MRQAGEPEHVAESERNFVEWVLQEVAWQEVVRPSLCLRRSKEDQRVEAYSRQREKQNDRAGAEHQHGLDDLHPARCQHTADSDIDDHAQTDQHYRDIIAKSKQQLDQKAGTRHLRNEIGKVDDDRTDDRCGERWWPAHPIHNDVANCVSAGVAQRFCDQEQNGAESNQRTDGVERAIHAV